MYISGMVIYKYLIAFNPYTDLIFMILHPALIIQDLFENN